MSGWGAAVFNIFATFPVNKTVFRQVVYNISMRDALKQLTSEGVIYIYRGILPPLLQKSACSSLMFGTYSHYSRIITDTIGSKDNQASEHSMQRVVSTLKISNMKKHAFSPAEYM